MRAVRSLNALQLANKRKERERERDVVLPGERGNSLATPFSALHPREFLDPSLRSLGDPSLWWVLSLTMGWRKI